MGIAYYREVAKRIKTFDLHSEAGDVIEETNPELRAILKEQWKQGKDKNGKAIARYRSVKYAQAKYAFNSKAGLGNVDMTITGRQGDGLKFSMVGDKVFTRSDERKYDKLSTKYPDAYGIDEDGRTVYRREILRPRLLSRFRKKVLQ